MKGILAPAAACLLSIFAVAPPSAQAQSRSRAGDEARPRDLQRLQDDLANLDEELSSLEPADRGAEEFRNRAEEIREDVIYLKVKMRRHAGDGGEGTGVLYEEVADVRKAIADLREDMDRAFSGGSARDATLDQGTEFFVRLEEPLSSKTARIEDRFEAVLPQPVRSGDRTAIPAGARVRGIVKDVEPAHRPSKGGRLELYFDTLYLDRTRLDIRAPVVSIEQDKDNDKVGTAGKAGIGAVLGGVLGGIIGGKNGAIVGTLLGGSGAVVGTKGEEVELPAGTLVRIRLDRPLTIPLD
jgi:hypothetical protein